MTKRKKQKAKKCCSKRKIKILRILSKLHDIPKFLIGMPTNNKRRIRLEYKKVNRILAKSQKELDETRREFKKKAKTFSGT